VIPKLTLPEMPWPPSKESPEHEPSHHEYESDNDSLLLTIAFEQEIGDYDQYGNGDESVRTVTENSAAAIKAEMEQRGLWAALIAGSST
jgi:hypothetical protein